MADDIVTRLANACAHPCDLCGRENAYVVGEDAADEIKRLRRWKAEATEVIGRWDAIADSVPCQLGQRRSDAVAAEIERLTVHNKYLQDIAEHLLKEAQRG